jgi:hypothetical protein
MHKRRGVIDQLGDIFAKSSAPRCATSQKFAGSIADGVIGIFH